MWPVFPARISQPFADPGGYASVRDSHGPAGHHTGVDFGSAWPIPISGRKVRSVAGGVVVISEYNSTMGNWVGVYNRKNDLLVTYWHLESRDVKVGQVVRVFEVLGKVGSTGNSTAAHLHVQVNRGRVFNYHGHINPSIAFGLWKRGEARKRARAHRRAN